MKKNKIKRFIALMLLTALFLIANSCGKKRKEGVLEIKTVTSDGSEAWYRVDQVVSSKYTPLTVVRDDKYGGSDGFTKRTYIYYWPDKNAARLGYKRRTDFLIGNVFVSKSGEEAAGEKGYWNSHYDYPAVWERKIGVFCKASQKTIPQIYFISDNSIWYPSQKDEATARIFPITVYPDGYLTYRVQLYTSTGKEGETITGNINEADLLGTQVNMLEIIPTGTTAALSLNGKFIGNNAVNNSELNGAWGFSVCESSVEQVWNFGCDNTGSFTKPDCSGVCETTTYPFTYTDDGSKINVYYTQPPAINCGGFTGQYPPKPADEAFTYTISGETLNIKIGTTTFNFKRKSKC